MLKLGIEKKLTIEVTENMTAAGLAGPDAAPVEGAEDLKSGDEQPVLATPFLIAFLEGVAAASVESELEKGQTTVGTAIEIRHLAATPAGMSVTFETTLVEIDGNRLVFEAKASDDFEMIGKGRIERFIINIDKFSLGIAAKQAKFKAQNIS